MINSTRDAAKQLPDIAVTPALAELSIIVPTLNERDNIRPFLKSLDAALLDIAWEVVFVDDDSKDGTIEEIGLISRTDPRVRLLHRIGRRGLSSACIEGVLSTSTPIVAIMDADLQHDERVLPQMFDILRTAPVDIVVGSRYIAGGSIGAWDSGRAKISSLATKLSQWVCRTSVADPMSGFFMFQRAAFNGAVRNLSGQGFKILLDFLSSAPAPLRVREIPFQFRTRQHGDSKLDTLVAWEFGMLLADKTIGHLIPVRFALFSAIGLIGLVVHLIMLDAGLSELGSSFAVAQGVATFVAMTSNFFLNNFFTYRDKRLRGFDLLRGLFSFYLICGLGAVANIGIAAYVFSNHEAWWIAGAAGAIVGSVWNYGVSSIYTWKGRN